MKVLIRMGIATVIGILSLSVFSSNQACAETGETVATATESGSRLKLLNFHAGGFAAFGAVGDSQSGYLAWTPRFAITPQLSVRGNLGSTLLKGVSSNYVASDLQAMVGYRVLQPLLVEAGGGVEAWWGNGGFAPVAGGAVSYVMGSPLLKVIDRFFVNYSRFFLSTNGTHQIIAGLGISI